MGEGRRRPGPGPRPHQGFAGSAARRRCLRRADQRGGQRLAAAPVAGNLGRDRRDGSVDRARAGDGRRFLLRPEPVQPCDAGNAAARFVVQAFRLRCRARQRLHPCDRGDRLPDRDRSGPGYAGMAAGELFHRKVLRPADPAFRHRAFAQRHDGAARPGRRHADDRGIRQAFRRLRQPADLPLVLARSRRDDGAAHGHRLFDVRQRRQAHHSDVHRPHPGSLRPHRLQARPA